MSSVLSSITDKYRITYNMIRGYVSDSAIYRIAQDWISVPEDKGIHGSPLASIWKFCLLADQVMRH